MIQSLGVMFVVNAFITLWVTRNSKVTQNTPLVILITAAILTVVETVGLKLLIQ